MMWFKILLLAMLVLNLPGCAVSKKEARIHQLEMQISELDKKLVENEQEIRRLESILKESQEQKATVVKSRLTKKPSTSKATPQLIQTALKKAGFYNGPIDGKIGEKTKVAIKEFQGKNGLTADGVVGKKTWSKLKTYLD